MDAHGGASSPNTPIRLNIAKACGLTAAVIGFTALLGWLLDIPILATFASGMIPMAPSTAFFFMGYGAGAPFLLSRPQRGRPAQAAAFILASLGLLAVGALFVLSLKGIHLNIEHFGIPMGGNVAGSPIGHMSPFTAFCFILAGMAFLLALPKNGRHLWLSTIAFWCAVSLSLLSLSLLMAYILGEPLLYGSGFIPPAFSTSMAFLFLGLGMAFAVWPRAGVRAAKPEGSRFPYHLLMIFALLTGIFILGGYLLLKKHEREYRTGVGRQLSAIVNLKAQRIADWLTERRADAGELAGNRDFGERVDRWLSRNDEGERGNITFRLESMQARHGYDGVALLDRAGRTLLADGDLIKPSPPLAEAMARAGASGRVEESGLYRDSLGTIRITWAAPIMAGQEESERPVATALLSARAETLLYPFLREWPGESRSAETLLVRRDGDEVLFLNNLRFKEDAALNLRFPLRKVSLPSAQAAMGREGLFMGRDYRGVPVLSLLKAVPGSPWFLVARVDLEEIQSPLRNRLWGVVLTIFALLAGAGAALALQWQWQKNEFMRLAAEKDRRLAAELEKLVAERTAKLDAVNRELESFSYSVSHDLKAPLRGIDGYSRLLDDEYRDRLDEQGREFIAGIRRSVTQMHQLIEDLLAYSRMERRDLHQTRINLSALLRTLAERIKENLTQPETVLKIEVPGLSLRADRDGLTMALRNLLDNAVKFSRNAQPPIIEIGARPENGMILIWVRDNGIGFEMKFHELIFGMFNRLERAEDFPGTGVGLALVRKAMERMGGRVWAESEPGKGAVFYLELPLAEDQTGEEDAAEEEDEEEEENTRPAAG